MFKIFKDAVQKQIKQMSNGELFFVELDKDYLWNLYLSSFPEGTNEIFRERSEYDCSCCKNFIRNFGNVVSIAPHGELESIWDIDLNHSTYTPVAKALSKIVKASKVAGIYRSNEHKIGNNFNRELIGSTVKTWEHFYTDLDSKFVISGSIGEFNGVAKANFDVLKRSMEEITFESCEIVKELIDQNSLYRGAEHLSVVKSLIGTKQRFQQFKSMDLNEEGEELYFWATSSLLKASGRYKNTVIGTLLSDLSEGVELADAVRMFESKVAPENYKRSSALITKSMIKKAEDKVADLGIQESLQRRYAVADDVTVNNVLFADRSVRPSMGGVFEELKNEVPDNVPDFDKVQEVAIDKFISDVLPTATGVELMVENNHVGNLVSVIAPSNPEAPNILKWNNNFSWTYNGDVTDSIKERVKKAGGKVDGFLRFSLSWFNGDDLDIHAVEPCGNRIFHGKKRGKFGSLDVDMNAGNINSRDPVENIVFREGMNEGKYCIIVNQYTKRETKDTGFEMEMEFNGKITKFNYPKDLKTGENVQVIEIEYSRKNGVKILNSIPTASTSKEIWNINTMKWQKVSMVMKSPNHWDENETGNKHWFFILDNCKNPDKARGLYNEFLKNDLNEHRKVFEVLGSKMKAPESDSQLSGVGYSSTVANSVLCKVSGKTNRVIKLTF